MEHQFINPIEYTEYYGVVKIDQVLEEIKKKVGDNLGDAQSVLVILYGSSPNISKIIPNLRDEIEESMNKDAYLQWVHESDDDFTEDTMAYRILLTDADRLLDREI